jgi:lipoprotein
MKLNCRQNSRQRLPSIIAFEPFITSPGAMSGCSAKM